jgi:glycosyltransferase involved in cell wall biosynthesis
MVTVYVPFDLPMYGAERNSHHPLLAGLYRGEPYADIRFVSPLAPAQAGGHRAEVQAASAKLTARLEPVLRGRCPDPADAIRKFIETREPEQQAQTDLSADLTFFHTAPLSLLQMPFVLHTETITTILSPMVLTGYMEAGFRLRREPIYWIIRAYLESPACTSVFTNLRLTKTGLERVFDSPAIAAKTHHVTAGPNLTPAQRRRVEEGFARKQAKKAGDEIEILFTNSWHQHPTNFLLRGGHDLLGAFIAISNANPNVRLTMRTSVPETGLSPEFVKILRGHPKVTLLEDKMTDDEIIDLFARADIFVLHAAALHSVSVMRALYAGCACVVSDAPGYEEYVADGQTGLVVRGMHEAIYTTDPESGFEFDNYRIFLPATQKLFQPFAYQLFAVCQDEALRRRLGAEARARSLAADGDTVWRAAFERLVHEGYAKTRGAGHSS